MQVSHFVLNRAFNLSEEVTGFKAEYYEDLFLDKAEKLKRELWALGCHANADYHRDFEGSQIKLWQIHLYVPNIKPEKLRNGEISVQTNVHQVAQFILFLNSKKFINFGAQKQELEKAYGTQAVMWAERFKDHPEKLREFAPAP